MQRKKNNQFFLPECIQNKKTVKEERNFSFESFNLNRTLNRWKKTNRFQNEVHPNRSFHFFLQ